MSAGQVGGASTVLATGSARTPERVHTEVGLLLLIANELGATILQPLDGFARRNIASPIFSYEIDLAISILLILLFFAGTLLVVSGRRPFGPTHSERTIIALVLSLTVTINELFLLPYWLPVVTTVLPGNVVFAVTGMVETGISVTATTLLTYSLQSLRGRILLWLGGLVGLGLAVAYDSQILHVFSYYPDIIQRTIVSLGALSSALFAAAYLAAWSRVRTEGPAAIVST